jgi:hypothetical protein
MGSSDVEAFLTHLAVNEHVSAPTQNQALQALLFLYRQALEINLPWLAFPAHSLCRDVYTGEAVRHHCTRRPCSGRCNLPYGRRVFFSRRVAIPFGIALRHSHGAGIAGSRRCKNHDDLHARARKGRHGRESPLDRV